MKKRIKSMVSMSFLVIILMCILTACSTKLSGTYTNEDGLVKQSFTFKEDNKVEVSAFGIEVEGEYLIKNDTITITYSLLNLSYDWEKSFRKDGNSIFIDGVEFTKDKQFFKITKDKGEVQYEKNYGHTSYRHDSAQQCSN